MTKNLKSLIILFKAQQTLENQVKQSLIGTGLSVNEFMVLEALHHKEGLNTGELIQTILLPNSSMTYVLDTLQKKNLIIRNKNEADKRIQILSLTPEGEEEFQRIYAKHYDYMRKIFDVLTEEEEFVLQTLLKKVGKQEMEDLT